MANLIRGRQDFLFNTLSTKDFGMYYAGGVATGEPHFVIKEPGIDIPCGDAEVKVLSPSSGQKKIVTVSIDWKWDGSSVKVFQLSVTKQPLMTGFGHEQFPVTHSYQFKMQRFGTTTAGTLRNDDKDAIVNGIIAAINADVKVNANAVNTGAIVAASNSSHKLVLEAKDFDVDFTVETGEDFSQVLTTPFKKSTLTNDDIARLFAVKAENEGQWANQPIKGGAYTKIQIIQKTKGYDNTSATAYNVREQIYNLYVLTSLIDDDIFTKLAVPAGDPLAVASMTDETGSTNASLEDYLAYIGASVLPTDIVIPATGTCSEGNDFNLGAQIIFTPANANRNVKFASVIPVNVTVDANGICKKGSSAGASTITVTTINGIAKTCTVTSS